MTETDIRGVADESIEVEAPARARASRLPMIALVLALVVAIVGVLVVLTRSGDDDVETIAALDGLRDDLLRVEVTDPDDPEVVFAGVLGLDPLRMDLSAELTDPVSTTIRFVLLDDDIYASFEAEPAGWVRVNDVASEVFPFDLNPLVAFDPADFVVSATDAEAGTVTYSDGLLFVVVRDGEVVRLIGTVATAQLQIDVLERGVDTPVTIPEGPIVDAPTPPTAFVDTPECRDRRDDIRRAVPLEADARAFMADCLDDTAVDVDTLGPALADAVERGSAADVRTLLDPLADFFADRFSFVGSPECAAPVDVRTSTRYVTGDGDPYFRVRVDASAGQYAEHVEVEIGVLTGAFTGGGGGSSGSAC